MNEKEITERLKKELGEVDLKSIDKNKLAKELEHMYVCIKNKYKYSMPLLESIYIVGSFAEGSAIKTVSDLDIRYVVQSEPVKEQIDFVKQYSKRNWERHLSDYDLLFGYVDAGLSYKKPKTTHIKIK